MRRRQRDLKDCGVFAILYLIEYYHGYVPIEILRDDTKTTTLGVNAFNIIETLKKYHFDAEGLKVKLKDLNKVTLPCIAHLKSKSIEHFVVITKVTKNRVYVYDPSLKVKYYKIIEFNEVFDGVIISAVPYDMVPKLPKDKSILSLIFNLIYDNKTPFIIILLLNIFIFILSIFYSLYLKVGLSSYDQEFFKDIFIKIIIVFLSIFFTKSFLSFTKDQIILYFKEKIDVNYIYSFLKHIIYIPVSKYLSYHISDIIRRIEDSRNLKDFVIELSVNLIFNLCSSLILIIIFYIIYFKFGLIISIYLVIYFILIIIVSRREYLIILDILNNENKYQMNYIDVLNMFISMKHMHSEKFILKKINNDLCEYLEDNLIYQKRMQLLSFLKKHLLEILTFIMFSYGIYLVGLKKINILTFIAFQSLYYYLISLVEGLSSLTNSVYYLKGIILKLSEYMNITEEDKTENNLKIESITFKNVKASYINNIVLENFSMDIRPKNKVLLRGKSGSGKSTICKLIMKELDYEGEILYDYQNSFDYHVMDIRDNIVYLSQNDKIFNDTIKNNILFGLEDDNERLKKIIKITKLDDVIKKRGMRIESSIDEESLSGGEKNRILLARTIYSKRNVYILDEPLREVGLNLEIDIIKDILEFLKDKVVIYISHRDVSKLFERIIDLDEI